MSTKKVYTRTGDKGTTSLYNGERLPKDDLIFVILGDIDSLGIWIADARYHAKQSSDISNQLLEIQNLLFDLGSNVATPRTNSPEHKVLSTIFTVDQTTKIETWIDKIHVKLPPLKNFVIPSGTPCSSAFHHARVTCRQLERNLIKFKRRGPLDEGVYTFINRLSDYLFVCSRYALIDDNACEDIYINKRSS